MQACAHTHVCCVSYDRRARPDDARGYFAVPYSHQRLFPPSSLSFSVYGHIQPKSGLLCSYYTRAVAVASDGSCLLPFERTSFLPIYCTTIQQRAPQPPHDRHN
jgi:hypothetical protein